MTDEYSNRIAEPQPEDLKHDRVALSKQELRAMQLFADGLVGSEVAEEMNIETSTAFSYKYRAEEKLEEQVQVIESLIHQQVVANRVGALREIQETVTSQLEELSQADSSENDE